MQRRTANGSTLEVTIQEGKNREVRRVFARVGYKVLSLTRTSIGPLSIRGLKEGRWRALSREEVEALLEIPSTEHGEEDPLDPRGPRRRGSSRRGPSRRGSSRRGPAGRSRRSSSRRR